MPSLRTFKQNRRERKRWGVRPILNRKMNAKAVEITKSRTKNTENMVTHVFRKNAPNKLAVVSPVYKQFGIDYYAVPGSLTDDADE